jgi:benzil reductase ((S)-benzoin forming)
MLGTMTQPDNPAASAGEAVTIVTGASRGVGAALAAELLERGERALTLQRHPNPTLVRFGARVESWAIDLTDAPAAAARLERWLTELPALLGAPPARITLINNAALLTDPAPMRHPSSADASAALRVGLEAPVLLSGAFLRATQHWPSQRRLLQISSGLGRRAMGGAAVYCAVKAGLDHFSRAVALEEADQPNGARSVSIAPGVIDTDMQRQLRGADPAVFGAQKQFQALKDGRQLDSAQACALKLLAYLARPDFGSQPVADIRDAA